MANMVVKTEYPKNQKQIFIADSQMLSLSARIGNTGVSTVNGKKIVKAGTPLKGDLKARNTAFTVAGENDAVVGIAVHDVDVTAGTENGAVAFFGIVDLEKLEADVQEKITSGVETALNGKIFFTTGSGNALA